MPRYELIREIFNLCANNQMRDVFVSEVAARVYCKGNEVTVKKTVREDGTILYDIVADGLHQRLSFTPD